MEDLPPIGGYTLSALKAAEQELSSGTIGTLSQSPTRLLRERIINARRYVPVYGDLFSSLGPVPDEEEELFLWLQNGFVAQMGRGIPCLNPVG
ncbi:hypothetical protein [Ruegeria sp. EL01]|jgi:hypothetical protein|uniref:hypothetical protein n=1 Tax=Ruegeria sp. EL01 TaxID=2107578 RepID=UPI0013C48368|nr:hypothetical protein [Ruegeria sp. EL01]